MLSETNSNIDLCVLELRRNWWLLRSHGDKEGFPHGVKNWEILLPLSSVTRIQRDGYSKPLRTEAPEALGAVRQRILYYFNNNYLELHEQWIQMRSAKKTWLWKLNVVLLVLTSPLKIPSLCVLCHYEVSLQFKEQNFQGFLFGFLRKICLGFVFFVWVFFLVSLFFNFIW